MLDLKRGGFKNHDDICFKRDQNGGGMGKRGNNPAWRVDIPLDPAVDDPGGASVFARKGMLRSICFGVLSS